MKYLTVLVGAAVIGIAVQSGTALAGPSGDNVSRGVPVSAATCSQAGSLVVNVTWKAINDYDSSTSGTAWANDSLNRHLQVYDMGPSTSTPGDESFCAIVKDQGSFVTFAGVSPNDSSVTIDAGITGTIQGGYVATFDGSLPSGKQTGNLGTIDYGCTDAYNCPTAFDWPDYYFGPDADSTFAQPYWSWTYRAGRNGTWVNSVTGNSGNITG